VGCRCNRRRSGESPGSPSKAVLPALPRSTGELPPLNPIALRDSREDVDGVCSDPTRPLHHKSKRARQREMSQATKQADKPRSDAFEGEPGFSPDLHLHPTLLKPRRNDDSMRTLTPTLPPLNPIALCDSQQDVDGL